MGAGTGVGTAGSGLNCGLVVKVGGVGAAIDCLTLRIPGTDSGKDFTDEEL